VKKRVILGLIGAAVVVGFFAALISSSRSSTPPPAIVPLDAEVLFDGMQFRIRNSEGRAWTDIGLEINGPSKRYEYKVDGLQPGETVTIEATRFVSADGMRFNPLERKTLNLMISAGVDATGTRGIWKGALK